MGNPGLTFVSDALQALDSFRKRYMPRERNPRVKALPYELRQLGPSDKLRLLNQAPASAVVFGWPPKSRSEPSNRYLWVIDDRGIPYILEVPLHVLGFELPKHTNLTGGGPAYVGGELWFADEATIFVSGGSGRYPPLDEDQLMAATEVFSSYRYTVKSLGWDSVTGYSKRFLEDI